MTLVANSKNGVIHETRLATYLCHLDTILRDEQLDPEKAVRWIKEYNYTFCEHCFPEPEEKEERTHGSSYGKIKSSLEILK